MVVFGKNNQFKSPLAMLQGGIVLYMLHIA